MEDKKYLKILIEDFESGKIDFDFVKDKIKTLTNKDIDENILQSYHGWTSLEELCEMLAEKPIENWNEIDDEKAKLLISEMMTEEISERIFEKNADALEKRYGKPTGFLHSLIFWQENITENKILEELKMDKKIYL